ncbi:MAG: DMT family transporter [Pseudomonadota bacterium]
MTSSPIAPTTDNQSAGIAFVLIAMLSISVNDMLIKFLSGDYPLHQMVFVRSVIGIGASMVFLQMEGGLKLLRTGRLGLQILRGLLIVVANVSYFAALAVLPLADATALFFVAPLLITLLSIPLLGEKVGPLRIGAVSLGFVGVLIMLRPWAGTEERAIPLAIMALPILGALTYALNQILTRHLGATTKASALAIYIQATFIVVSAIFYIAAGDGRYVDAVENESLRFLLRPWVWPDEPDMWLFAGLGLNSAIIGYALSQAYRMADAATVAPFEYVGLPLAILWGWMIWGELPGPSIAMGIVLIVGSGLFVFLRERQKKIRLASTKRVDRRY